MAKYTAKLTIPCARLAYYERLMNLPAGHPDLESFPKYALIESWTVPFADPRYEAQLKVCSSAHGDPLWSEAILFCDGNQICYSDPEAELEGDWFFFDDEEHQKLVLTVFSEDEINIEKE